MKAARPRVVVLDMQPIAPAVGGGRMRLLGLYRDLGLPVTYVGTYDWQGEQHRDHRLSPTLREIDVPLSAEHFAAAAALQREVGGKTVIDAAFHDQVHLSEAFIEETRRQVAEADIVVVSHPWCYPQVREVIDRQRQLLVYDAHNVEGYLKFVLLDDGGGPGTRVVRRLVEVEHALCHDADLIVACSADDRELFCKLYGSGSRKTVLIPNGVFTSQIVPADRSGRQRARRALGLQRSSSALFIGSGYRPNADAASFIVGQLAPRLPEVKFLIAGGVCEAFARRPLPANVRALGVVDDATKLELLHAADVAVNPMFEGSGTAVKMFDFMAAGLPVVSTAVGARGIVDATAAGVVVVPAEEHAASLRALLADEPRRLALGERNRRLAEDRFSWERISANLGRLLAEAWADRRPRPVTTAAGLPRSGPAPKLALLSTWHIRCGIGEYSSAFASALRREQAGVLTIANARTGAADESERTADDGEVAFLWDYDNVRWRDSRIHTGAILELLRRRGIRHVSVQYHPGFYSPGQLRAFASACREAGVSVCVTLHNSKLVELQDLRALAEDAVLLTLSDDDRVRLGNGGVRADYLPLGVDDSRVGSRAPRAPGPPVLGTFGFIRAHKGLLPLVEAFGHLAGRVPGITLRAYTALYPSEDSRAYHRRCVEAIEHRNLTGAVEFVTDFLPIDEQLKRLHACDLVVLPYEPSDEGASAAASTAIAAGCPLAVSSSGIFNEIRDVVHTLDSCEPVAMAAELERLLAEPGRLEALATAAAGYARWASWQSVAERYLERYVLPPRTPLRLVTDAAPPLAGLAS